jgi:hypothetical protein
MVTRCCDGIVVMFSGSVLSPHTVGSMKPGKLWKTKRVSLLLLYITVLLTTTNTSSRTRLRPGELRVLTITIGNKVGVDVTE